MTTKETSSAAAPANDGALSPQVWKIMGVVILAPLMTQMDSTIVNVSLSSIRDDLHSTLSSAQWVISAYLLALALVLPLNGWLLDRFGAKKLYIFCFTAFTLASFLCGAADSMNTLVAARVLQGIAGGLLVPLTQFMVARVAGKQMARVVGYISAPVLLAPLFGPLLAGLILKKAGWPWLFYVNLPIGLIAVVLAILVLPRDDSLGAKRSFDLPGFLTLSPGLSCLLYGFERLTHHKGAGVLILGAALLGAFFWIARRKKDRALIDLELFRIHTFSVAVATQFLANGLIYCGQFLVPLYLISGAGLSPADAGLVLSAMGIGMLCVSPLMGAITDRYGCRGVTMVGVLLNSIGTFPFLWMAYEHYSPVLAIVGLLLRGIGQGATGIPSMAAAYASVPRSRLSYAATSINIVQRLGGPILTTALAMVVASSLTGAPSGDAHAFQVPFLALIGFQLLVLLTAIQLPWRIVHAAD